MNDTRFSSAVHLLVLVSEAEVPMSSAQIAQSIGANPSWVRRLAASLRGAGIIASRRGATGFSLAVPADALTLLDVYRAACDADEVRVFDLHRNPSDECIVGRHIRPVLGEMLAQVDEAAMRALESQTLADCIARMRREAKAAGEVPPGEGVRS
jgi:Rrf2 family protein